MLVDIGNLGGVLQGEAGGDQEAVDVVACGVDPAAVAVADEAIEALPVGPAQGTFVGLGGKIGEEGLGHVGQVGLGGVPGGDVQAAVGMVLMVVVPDQRDEQVLRGGDVDLVGGGIGIPAHSDGGNFDTTLGSSSSG
ncbi:hypothetical protein ES708_19336 [subsurface metagenome]